MARPMGWGAAVLLLLSGCGPAAGLWMAATAEDETEVPVCSVGEHPRARLRLGPAAVVDLAKVGARLIDRAGGPETVAAVGLGLPLGRAVLGAPDGLPAVSPGATTLDPSQVVGVYTSPRRLLILDADGGFHLDAPRRQGRFDLGVCSRGGPLGPLVDLLVLEPDPDGGREDGPALVLERQGADGGWYDRSSGELFRPLAESEPQGGVR